MPAILNFFSQSRVFIMLMAILVVFGLGWQTGYSAKSKDKDLAESRQAVKVLQIEAKQAEIKEKVVVQYVDKIRIIKEKGEVITKQVPVYITKESDSQCNIPESFGLLWNATNRGDIPTSARIADETTSAIVLSDIAAQHATEATICRATEQQLISLQDWIKQQQ